MPKVLTADSTTPTGLAWKGNGPPLVLTLESVPPPGNLVLNQSVSLTATASRPPDVNMVRFDYRKNGGAWDTRNAGGVGGPPGGPFSMSSTEGQMVAGDVLEYRAANPPGPLLGDTAATVYSNVITFNMVEPFTGPVLTILPRNGSLILNKTAQFIVDSDSNLYDPVKLERKVGSGAWAAVALSANLRETPGQYMMESNVTGGGMVVGSTVTWRMKLTDPAGAVVYSDEVPTTIVGDTNGPPATLTLRVREGDGPFEWNKTYHTTVETDIGTSVTTASGPMKVYYSTDGGVTWAWVNTYNVSQALWSSDIRLTVDNALEYQIRATWDLDGVTLQSNVLVWPVVPVVNFSIPVFLNGDPNAVDPHTDYTVSVTATGGPVPAGTSAWLRFSTESAQWGQVSEMTSADGGVTWTGIYRADVLPEHNQILATLGATGSVDGTSNPVLWVTPA